MFCRPVSSPSNVINSNDRVVDTILGYSTLRTSQEYAGEFYPPPDETAFTSLTPACRLDRGGYYTPTPS
jgi:hypothetical protein